MYFTAICANDRDIEVHAFNLQGKNPVAVPTEVSISLIGHEKAYMVEPWVLLEMLKKWKESFHPSELPIRDSMKDAPAAFVTWLADQPLRYVFLETNHPLISLPIYDVVEAVH
jgi:hypothetical protein